MALFHSKLSLLLLVVLTTSWSQCHAQFESVDVDFIEGYSQPRRISNLAASTNGIIAELVAEEGAMVRDGECIVRLDARVQRQLVEIARLRKHAQGELEAAEAEVRIAERMLRIIRELLAKDSATPDELIRTESDYELAMAKLKSVQESLVLREAEHQKLLEESENFSINAPFDGFLVEYVKEKGEFVGVADPVVCVVADLSELSVEFIVQGKHRSRLHVNAPLEVHFVESGRRVEGRMIYISPFPDGETNTYKVKVSVPNPNYELNAGERCQIELQARGFRQVAKPQQGVEYVSHEDHPAQAK